MSVEELKQAVTILSAGEQNELSAFLFHLRQRAEGAYQTAVAERLADKEPSHWLTPEEFQDRLDQK